MGQRKVQVKQKKSIKNAIMEDMKLPADKTVCRQWDIPIEQLIQKEDNGDTSTSQIINENLSFKKVICTFLAPALSPPTRMF